MASIKTLLGLEQSEFTEMQIMNKIREARRKKLTEVVFTAGKKRVKVKLSQIDPTGLTRGYWDYAGEKRRE